ncbi:MAG: methyltransferase family protein [Nitrospirales bacterium]
MTNFYSHYGHWGLVLIMIVGASWLLYRYVAPKNWREWSGAGLVQAFIIALYAEMYGFPLTIYLLTGFLGIDLRLTSHSGHLWATLLGYGETGAMIEMFLGYSFVFLGISLLAQGWREVYRASRERRLASNGLYGAVRHPQYTGILLAVFGQLIHWPTILTVALFPVIVWVYIGLARREESGMSNQFGDEYRSYQARVPMFLPRLGGWRKLLREAAGEQT